MCTYAADGVDPGPRAFLALPKQRRSSWKLIKAKIKRFMRSPDEWAGSTAEHMRACSPLSHRHHQHVCARK